MKAFKDRLLALVDNTANQARDLIGSFSTMVDEIDWDNHFNSASEFMRERKESLTAKANDLLKDFSDLIKQVKDNLTDFSVMVPFDESIGEKLEYNVVKNDDGTSSLVVEVSYNDENTMRSNKTTVRIPQNCDLTRITKTVNKVSKTATIIIPKVVIEPTMEKDAKENETSTASMRKKERKVTRKKVNEALASAENPEVTHLSSKLAEKLKQNVEKAKQRRDARGKFMRKDVLVN